MGPNLSPGCFYGTLSKSLNVSGVGLTEILYPENHETLEHAHERAYFSLTLAGGYKKQYGNKVVACTPETLIFHPSGQKQSGRCETGGRSFVIEVSPQVLARVENYSGVWERLAVSRGGSLTRIAARLYKEFRMVDELSPLAIEGLVLEMMVDVARRKMGSSHSRPPFWLEQTKDLLHSSFSENLNLVHIAELAGVHPVHMATEFRRFYKSTIGEYVRRLRIDFACREIAETKTPLIDIALAAGFSSHSHFSTVFKRVTGMTPGRYRTLQLTNVEFRGLV